MDHTYCQRCEAKLQVNPKQQSNAKMLRRSNQAKGFCVNCALHDWLRNTYPVNLIFTTLSPEALRLEHIQEQLTGIMRSQNADATPDEINWEAIIANWDLPFKNKVKGTPTNPASQDVLDMEPEMQARQEQNFREETVAKEEGFESLFDKQQAERVRIVNEEFLPLMRKMEKQE